MGIMWGYLINLFLQNIRMATINFFLKYKKDPTAVYVRFRHGRKFDITKSTHKLISPKDWSETKKAPHPRDENLKKLAISLKKLEKEIEISFNDTDISNIDSEWLETIIKKHNKDYSFKSDEGNKTVNDSIVENIQHLIDTAAVRPNSKGSLGLSTSRINSYKNLLRIIKEYQGKKRLKVKDVDIQFGRKFLSWMLNRKKYAESYSLKKIDDLKTVCREAQVNGLEVSPQLPKVKGGKSKNKYILYLTPEELTKIEKTDFEQGYLRNAKKWLLFGCHIGQRVSDLLEITEENFVTRNGLEVIELKQKKTGSLVTIPILPKTREIIAEGLPATISSQNFNKYIKLVCKEAEIDQYVEGSLIPKEEGKKTSNTEKRKVEGQYQKWKLITSHICRRTFATNNYGVIPTPLLMKITAHSTERMFLNYIGKNSFDYAKMMANLYKEQK